MFLSSNSFTGLLLKGEYSHGKVYKIPKPCKEGGCTSVLTFFRLNSKEEAHTLAHEYQCPTYYINGMQWNLVCKRRRR